MEDYKNMIITCIDGFYHSGEFRVKTSIFSSTTLPSFIEFEKKDGNMLVVFSDKILSIEEV